MMSTLDPELSKLPGAMPLSQNRDGWWMFAPELDVKALAEFLHARGARLSTITGLALEDGETELIYHYVLGETAINFKTRTQRQAIASIAPLIPAAAWIEREIHDLYAVEFIGHPNLARLIRPPEIAQGFFREK